MGLDAARSWLLYSRRLRFGLHTSRLPRPRHAPLPAAISARCPALSFPLRWLYIHRYTLGGFRLIWRAVVLDWQGFGIEVAGPSPVAVSCVPVFLLLLFVSGRQRKNAALARAAPARPRSLPPSPLVPHPPRLPPAPPFFVALACLRRRPPSSPPSPKDLLEASRERTALGPSGHAPSPSEPEYGGSVTDTATRSVPIAAPLRPGATPIAPVTTHQHTPLWRSHFFWHRNLPSSSPTTTAIQQPSASMASRAS